MQKKHFLLVVVSLALLTTVYVVGRGSMASTFMSRMFGGPVIDGIGSGGFMPDNQYYEEGVTQVTPVPMVETKLALDSVGSTGMMAEPAMYYPQYFDDYSLDSSERYYEKSSYHSVVVKDVSKYIRGLKEYFTSIEGVILNSSVNSGDKYQSASLYVKVPVDNFDEATTRVTDDVKKVIDESLSANDITGQVINTQENVDALENQKSLLEAQLKDAKTELEKTRIQIQIDKLNKQIESAKKVQENVVTRTRYSSISITAADSERYFNPGISGDFEYELQRAWDSLKSFIKVLAVFGIWVAVYAIVWAPIAWIIGKVIQKFRK